MGRKEGKEEEIVRNREAKVGRGCQETGMWAKRFMGDKENRCETRERSMGE